MATLQQLQLMTLLEIANKENENTNYWMGTILTDALDSAIVDNEVCYIRFSGKYAGDWDTNLSRLGTIIHVHNLLAPKKGHLQLMHFESYLNSTVIHVGGENVEYHIGIKPL